MAGSAIMNIIFVFGISLLLIDYNNSSNFEIFSMRSSNEDIFLEDIIGKITSPHIFHCIDKCKELSNPSICNSIKFDTTTFSCVLAYRVVEDDCSASANGAQTAPGISAVWVSRDSYSNMPDSSRKYLVCCIFPSFVKWPERQF